MWCLAEIGEQEGRETRGPLARAGGLVEACRRTALRLGVGAVLGRCGAWALRCRGAAVLARALRRGKQWRRDCGVSESA